MFRSNSVLRKADEISIQTIRQISNHHSVVISLKTPNVFFYFKDDLAVSQEFTLKISFPFFIVTSVKSLKFYRQDLFEKNR